MWSYDTRHKSLQVVGSVEAWEGVFLGGFEGLELGLGSF